MVARILTPAEASAIQTALNEVAHAQLMVDGHFGALSQQAVMRFQADHNISPADGNPSQPTLDALGIPNLFSPPAKPHLTPNPVVQAIGSLALQLVLNRLLGKAINMDTVLATVKSAWLSKLNWTVAVGVVFNIFMFFGHPVPADVQANVITAGNSIVLVVAWIIRTWFTSSITTASAKKL